MRLARTPIRFALFSLVSLAVVGGAGAQSPARGLTDAERAFPDPEPMATGKFQPTWESLKQYECPKWFRDAKFGIWAHWTAQCVPEQGDWYARRMYIPAEADYKFHVAHYGHPSKVGFKEIDRLWRAKNWDPDRLMRLYKRAGAQYFFALANHHDNFDCYDSKYQPWNSVKLGPKRDVVGTWAKAARQHGLRFGVTVHAARAWSWFEVAQGADQDGPYAGVPYDGKLTKADGHGQWWEGLDPQDLYAQNHQPGRRYVRDWDPRAGSSVPDRAYCTKFYNRTLDLINKYHPDQVYFDDTVLPLYAVDPSLGLKIAAHFYNSNMRWHGGKLEAVLNGKRLDEEQRRSMVWDIERGRANKIEPQPWQTDTCIGVWHYNRGQKYKTAASVIQTLADIVSKNGNLMLNIPVRGDGTLDDQEIAILEEIARWMAVNREAIFGTRPWSVFGEGPASELAAPSGAGFNEDQAKPFTAEDVRFTTKGDALYAIALGWPADGKLTIKTLAAGAASAPKEIRRVRLLGADGNLAFTRDAGGLHLSLPERKPDTGNAAFVFRIASAS